MFKIINFVFSFGSLLLISEAEEYENQFGPDYGSEWLYYLDDNGTTHVMNFSSLPADTRSFLFGEAYFHLWTRRNPDNPEELILPEDNSPVKSEYYNGSNGLKAVTHGWLSDDNADWVQNIKNSYLRKYDTNVITIDWSELSKNPVYPWPALCTRYVGKKFAKLLEILRSQYGVDGENMHLVGHSLGAQVMGYAGMFFNGSVHRVTGLDPARPMFEFPPMPPEFMLERSDASFVDIIHSCGGVLGYRSSHGHADFYPNNGKPKQPGCEGRQQVMEACSHGRSHELFAESILSERGFPAYPCDSWDSFQRGECTTSPSNMGEPCADDSIGDYYLHTRNESKYASD